MRVPHVLNWDILDIACIVESTAQRIQTVSAARAKKGENAAAEEESQAGTATAR